MSINCNSSVLRTIVILVCTSGLLYQSIVLLVQYLNYSTVVTIQQKNLVNQHLPAITLCYDHFFSLKQLDKYRGPYQEMVDEFKTLHGQGDKEQAHKVT